MSNYFQQRCQDYCSVKEKYFKQPSLNQLESQMQKMNLGSWITQFTEVNRDGRPRHKYFIKSTKNMNLYDLQLSKDFVARHEKW